MKKVNAGMELHEGLMMMLENQEDIDKRLSEIEAKVQALMDSGEKMIEEEGES